MSTYIWILQRKSPFFKEYPIDEFSAKHMAEPAPLTKLKTKGHLAEEPDFYLEFSTDMHQSFETSPTTSEKLYFCLKSEDQNTIFLSKAENNWKKIGAYKISYNLRIHDWVRLESKRDLSVVVFVQKTGMF